MILKNGCLTVSHSVTGHQNFTETPMGGVSIFYTHKKRNRTKQNIPFAQFPRRPWCPFCAIRPCCPEKLPAPWGGYPFLTATPRGGTKILRRLRGGGGMHFLRALFPKSTTLPLTRNSKQSLTIEYSWPLYYHDFCKGSNEILYKNFELF